MLACCWRGDAAAIKLLLNAGADVSLCNQRGVSPLLMACHQGHHECAMLCLAAGADVDSADDRDFTPVYAAACRGHSEIVHDCIVIGADVKGATGARALIACCYKGHVDCAALLVHAGADVDAHHQDRTAVEWALHCGHLEAARVVEVCSKMRGAVPPNALAAMGSPAFEGARVNVTSAQTIGASEGAPAPYSSNRVFLVRLGSAKSLSAMVRAPSLRLSRGRSPIRSWRLQNQSRRLSRRALSLHTSSERVRWTQPRRSRPKEVRRVSASCVRPYTLGWSCRVELSLPMCAHAQAFLPM